MTLIFLHLLRLVLWPHVWSVLEGGRCALEKNAHSVLAGWSHICYIQFVYSVVSLPMFFQFFGLIVLSIIESGGSEVAYIIVLLSISPFISASHM